MPAFASLEDAVDQAVALRGDAVGTVRLNLPRLAAELLILPRISEFYASYPGVRLEMVIDDGLTDVVAKGFDAGIRNRERLAQDMIALRLTSAFRIAVVGSPGYFSDHPQPKSPFDLFAHACVDYRWASTGQLYRWPFLGTDGPLEVDVDGTLVLNDTGLIRDAAIRGVGLACLPETAGQPQIENGSLVRVLET